MKFFEAPIKGAFIIELEPLSDERGLFARTFCQEEFARIGFFKTIVQANHSITRKKGTVRGMHFQIPPACEAKIIRCISGKVFDVMVDLRAGSPTYLQWHGVELSKDNMRMVFLPEGLAHGFQALTDDTEMIYQHSVFYSPEYEKGLRFDDPALGIEWPLHVNVISPKDIDYPFIDSEFKGISI